MLRFWRPPRLGLLAVFVLLLGVLWIWYDPAVPVFAAISGAVAFAYGRHTCNDRDVEGHR